jgi:hypothetical protein
MKRKLCGAYYFEWLGQKDRQLGLTPKPIRTSTWPEWANTAYMYGYWLSPVLTNRANSGLQS